MTQHKERYLEPVVEELYVLQARNLMTEFSFATSEDSTVGTIEDEGEL